MCAALSHSHYGRSVCKSAPGLDVLPDDDTPWNIHEVGNIRACITYVFTFVLSKTLICDEARARTWTSPSSQSSGRFVPITGRS